jgi:hypothetical protein
MGQYIEHLTVQQGIITGASIAFVPAFLEDSSGGEDGGGMPGPPGLPGMPGLAGATGAQGLPGLDGQDAEEPFWARSLSSADLNGQGALWVPYTGPPQSFLSQNLTRDGDWTMVANKTTSDRPAPQPSAAEEDLLPAWTPSTQGARAGYSLYNEWTLNQTGWIDQYGVDILPGNLGATHTITLAVGGVIRDTFTTVPSTAGMYWHNIAPLIMTAGAVLRVSLAVTQVGNNVMNWLQQVALFATPPPYCSVAQGSKDGAPASSIAYGCHLLFVPGTKSPDWDIVAFSGTAAGGGGAALPADLQAIRAMRWY